MFRDIELAGYLPDCWLHKSRSGKIQLMMLFNWAYTIRWPLSVYTLLITDTYLNTCFTIDMIRPFSFLFEQAWPVSSLLPYKKNYAIKSPSPFIWPTADILGRCPVSYFLIFTSVLFAQLCVEVGLYHDVVRLGELHDPENVSISRSWCTDNGGTFNDYLLVISSIKYKCIHKPSPNGT